MTRQETPFLAEHITLLNQVLAASTDHIYVFDRAGRYQYVSPAGLAALGLQASDVLGQRWRDFNFPAEVMERHDVQRETVFETGMPITAETSFPTTDGVRHYEYVIAPIRDADGAIAAVINTSRDITQRQQTEDALHQLTEDLEARVTARTEELTTLNQALQREVAERQNAEQALRESESRFQALVEAMFEGVVVQENGRIIDANPGFASMFGYSLEEVMGKSAADFLTPESLAVVQQHIENQYEEPYEMTGVCKDGTLIDLEGVGKQSTYQGRRVRVSAARDITERKRAEAERTRLLQQEQTARREVEDLLKQLETERYRLEQVLQQMPVGASIAAAPSGQLLFHNDEAIQILRHPLREADTYEGYAQYGAIHADGQPYRPEEYPIARALLTGEIVRGEEMYYRRGDGTRTVFAVSAAPILDLEENLVAAVSTFEDIGDRKRLEAERQQAEQALRDSEQQLEIALKAAQAGAWTWELSTNQIYWSDSYYRIFGLEPGSIEPSFENGFSRLHPDDRTWVEQATSEAIAWGNSTNIEHRILLPDGTVRWVLGLGQMFYDETQQPMRMAGIVMDISDRKRAEDERKQAEIVLREKEQQMRQLSDSMPQFVWISNAQGETEYVNQRWLAYAGLTLDESLQPGKTTEFLHPDDLQAVAEGWALARANQQPFELELRLRRAADGDYRWFLMRSTPAIDAQGEVQRWYGTSTDIHDRKIAQLNEQFLSDLDRRLHRLSDSQAMEWEVVSSLGEYLQVDRCLWHTVDLESGVTTVGQDWYRQSDLQSTAGVYRLSEYILPEMIHHYGMGQPLVIEDVTTHAYTASVAHSFAQHKIRAILGVPWIESGRWVAALAVNSCTTRPWHSDEVKLLQEIVARLWSLIEQTRAIAALQEQGERTRLATEAADLGMWFWDLSHHELVWTDRCKAMFGLAADTPISYEVFLQTLHPEDREVAQAAVTRALEQKVDYDIEYRTRWPDGSIHWIAAKGRGFYNSDGQPVRMVGTAQDISDRKQAEVELRQSEALYRAIAHNFPNGAVHVFDHDLRYLLSDGEEMRQLGLSKGQLEGRTPSAVFPPETAAALEPCYRAALAGEATTTELAFTDQTYQIYTVPLRNDQGEIYAGLSISQNVTLLKQAEQTLRTSRDDLERQVQTRTQELRVTNELLQLREREFRTLVENTPDVITRHDRQHRCVYINPASLQSLGQPPEFFLGKTPAELGYPADLELLWNTSLENVFTTGQMRIDEFTVMGENGPLYYQVYVVPEKGADQSITSVMTIGRDVTQVRQSEESARQLAAELKRSNQELEQFAYIASHDLQEPLRAIASFTQLLAKRYQGQLDAKADTYMEFIVDGATRMQQLICDLLAYSRVGRHELKRQPIDCNVLLERIQRDLQITIAENAATITADPLPTVTADPTQFGNLLQNLISNALKYRSELPPQIHVAARKELFPSGEADVADPPRPSRSKVLEEWVFSIRDNGLGIEPQYAERIFGIFQRLHTREEYPGTGLGLAICRKIIERHGGRIWVESQLGEGSTFFFTLPVATELDYDRPTSPAANSSG